MVGVLTDIAGGTCSVLEPGYLTRIERPHGLPTGRRQVSERRGAGRPTVRLGCGQVFDRPCETTVRVAIFLRAGGWTGVPTASGPTCPV
jgi:hypothetical protein